MQGAHEVDGAFKDQLLEHHASPVQVVHLHEGKYKKKTKAPLYNRKQEKKRRQREAVGGNTHAKRRDKGLSIPGLFTGNDLTQPDAPPDPRIGLGGIQNLADPLGSGQEAFEISRVGSDRGSGRIGGRVGVGSGRIGGRVGSDRGSGRVGSGMIVSGQLGSGQLIIKFTDQVESGRVGLPSPHPRPVKTPG